MPLFFLQAAAPCPQRQYNPLSDIYFRQFLEKINEQARIQIKFKGKYLIFLVNTLINSEATKGSERHLIN